MIKCGECKYWGSKQPRFKEVDGMNRCGRLKELMEIRDEKWLQFVKSNQDRNPTAEELAYKEALKSETAYLEDGSDFYAALITGPTFGCTLGVAVYNAGTTSI